MHVLALGVIDHAVSTKPRIPSVGQQLVITSLDSARGRNRWRPRLKPRAADYQPIITPSSFYSYFSNRCLAGIVTTLSQLVEPGPGSWLNLWPRA